MDIVQRTGGSHAGNKLAMQEFMICPTGAKSFTEAMQMGSETYHHLKGVIKKKYGLDATAIGDEGGFAPNVQVRRLNVDSPNDGSLLVWMHLVGYSNQTQAVGNGIDRFPPVPFQDNTEGLHLLVDAIAKAGYTGKIKIAMDVASSEFYKDGVYDLDFKNPNSDKSQWKTGEQMLDLYKSFTTEFPVVSIEDPYDQV
jgi:enolase